MANPNATPNSWEVASETPAPSQPTQSNPWEVASETPSNAPALKVGAPSAQPMQTEGVVVPDAGRIPGVQSQGNKVTDQQAAGGLAAGAVAGAAPLAVGATVNAASEALPSVLMHTTDGVKALNAWAIKNPFQAVILYHAVKELLPGAKKAMGIIKSSPLPIE
jgi:hypothetical protein